MAYIFLSYAKDDQETAFDMREVLRKEGFLVWMDENVYELGFWHWSLVQRIIRNSGAFVVLLSDAAKESKWLKREIAYAQKIQKPIFPILIQGEAWENFEAEPLGLGTRLDIPDETVARIKASMTHDAPLAHQIPGDEFRSRLRYTLIALCIVGIIAVIILRAMPIVENYYREQRVTATAFVRENMTSTAQSIVPTFAPCTAQTNMDDGGVLEVYFTGNVNPEETTHYPLALGDVILDVTDRFENQYGVWYRVKLPTARTNLGYVHESDLVLSEACAQ